MKPPNGHPSVQLRPKRKLDRLYPIQTPVEYIVRRGRRIIETGKGQAIQLSSSELVLEAVQSLRSGLEIQVMLDWPGPPGDASSLRLRLQGRTRGSEGNRVTLHIDQFDFQIRPVAASGEPMKASRTPEVPDVAPLAS